jgi:endonuclease/exonuclease/phosphatase family metal-dependent hydrolase
VELRTEPVNAIAIMNTGRVIRDVDADILAVIEAENRVALKQFSDYVVHEVGGVPYDQVMVIDGNDQRGIDVGLMTKAGYNIDLMRSHIHDRNPDGSPIYSRDCPEFAVRTPEGDTIWFLPNHFKSKFGGDNADARAKRLAQATRTAEIYRQLRAAGHDKIVILGDLNDIPASDVLQPLLAATDLRDVSDHPTFDTGEFKGRPGTHERGIGTFGLGNDSQKIDYLLLSPPLFARVTASGLFRKGAWPGKSPRRWSVYPELEREIHVASDHHVIWATIGPPV